MGKKLFVGSLPFEFQENQLHELFGACGQVMTAQLILDRMTGRSRGFGFVEMSTEEEAQTAIQKMNGSTVGTRTIVVNEARPKEHRVPAGVGGGRFEGGGDWDGGGERGGGRRREGGRRESRW